MTKQYLDKIGADTKKIVETADKFREIYNELFEKINESRELYGKKVQNHGR